MPSCQAPAFLTIPVLALTLACASTPPSPGPEAEAGGAADTTAAAREHDAADPALETFSNTIRWTTASEVDNFGFDVFRGESADGPFERLNPEVIEGAGTSDEPREYRWVDEDIDPHQAYWYYVESISMTGERELFTPIGKAPPKVPTKGEDDGEGSGDSREDDAGPSSP